MLLYTARPLERIYASPAVFDHTGRYKETKDKAEEPEYREVMLPSGRIVTRRDGEDYVIESIYSTDMKDYLNENYFPGKNYADNIGKTDSK